jgi:flagellar hook-associated protein 1
MSFLGLNIAGSALDTFQEAENVTAQNIANVQTPGASRQIVNIGQLPPIDGAPGFPVGLEPGTQGTGVLITSIQRVHQDSYDALFRGASSSQNFYSAESGVLSSLQASFGEPANGINTAYSAFQSAVQTLANNPQGTAEQQGVLTSANGLVTAISSANTALQSSETQTQTQATTLISTINSTIDQIAALNGQIRAATAVGDSPNTYEDQRDQLIDTLSTYLPTTTSIQADGSTLVTVDGQALVNDTQAYHLANPIVGTNPNGTPALQVDFVTPPNPVNPPAVNITGGQLGGLLDTYNNKLIPYSNQLNDFANALATEADRISQAGYDSTGTAGAQLFSPVVSQLPISAGNIQVGILTPSEVPTAEATTAAGTLVQPLNLGNTTVDTTAQLNGNQTLANAPAAGGITGTLKINVDGIVPPQTFSYSTNNSTADTVDDFINSFNAGHFGVTASYNATSQTVVFARDPNNIDLAHRAAMAASPAGATTPDFTISDSNAAALGFPVVPAAGSAAQPQAGVAATSLLAALGANQINGVDQNATNAIGVTNGGNVTSMLQLFTNSYGVPAIQTTSPTVIPAPPPAALATVFPATPGGFAQLNVGDVLTIDGGTAAQENVTITAVDRITGSISFVPKFGHAGGFTITSAQVSTLQQSYANLVAQMGNDSATANTGVSTQTSLSSSINAVRQSTDGINVDEETQNLVKFQNAYGAAAHVITVLSSMLEDAINLGTGTTF